MSERFSLGIIMDPISAITPETDTSLALLLAAQSRGWQLHYLEIPDLFLQYGAVWGNTRPLCVYDDPKHWYTVGEWAEQPLDQFDLLLMRKDPPVDMEYIYATYLLEHVESNGTLVVNRPRALRDANEKLFATWFPQCMPPTVVSASLQKIRAFIEAHGTVVMKPLNGMGGQGIFKCSIHDPNLTVIMETLTRGGTAYCMVQRFIPEIIEGDKRIFLIDGDPVPYALARIPQKGEFRGNLAAGGSGIGVRLTARDRWICAQVAPVLREKGLLFVGIDVIGEYLTEINVTSPTCIREVESAFGIDITERILDCMADKVQQ